MREQLRGLRELCAACGDDGGLGLGAGPSELVSDMRAGLLRQAERLGTNPYANPDPDPDPHSNPDPDH